MLPVFLHEASVTAADAPWQTARFMHTSQRLCREVQDELGAFTRHTRPLARSLCAAVPAPGGVGERLGEGEQVCTQG